LGDRQFSGDFNDSAWPRAYQFEYSSTSRIAQSGQLHAVFSHGWPTSETSANGTCHFGLGIGLSEYD
jgi:hypothetical protein